MTIYQPYTYLIGWTAHNKWYYGVRFADYCARDTANPSELWVSYFTSSKHVEEMRLQFGEPDVIQVRKLLSNKEQARSWEHKVLRRLNAACREDFLNKTDAISIPSQKGVKKPTGFAEKISRIHKDKKVSEETKKKLSEIAKNRIPSAESNAKRSATLKGRKTWNAGLSGYKRGPYKKKV